ncbi:hypothetical protein HC891_20360 [Candidatus Gracilibacteria bacterium]|nr:hypothetical protein [Candidatus Gracilibacteria bacterium]
MGLTPHYSDELITIYPVPEPALQRPLVYLGVGWGEIEANETQRWRWMGSSAEVYLWNPHSTPIPITLDLDAESYRQTRPLTLQLDGVPIGEISIGRAAPRVAYTCCCRPASMCYTWLPLPKQQTARKAAGSASPS